MSKTREARKLLLLSKGILAADNDKDFAPRAAATAAINPTTQLAPVVAALCPALQRITVDDRDCYSPFPQNFLFAAFSKQQPKLLFAPLPTKRRTRKSPAMAPSRTRTVKNKHAANKSGVTGSRASGKPQSDGVVKSKKPQQGKAPPAIQVKGRNRVAELLKNKKKKRVYTEEELGIPKLNMITPVGVLKPKGKKKGKVFVDDRVSLSKLLETRLVVWGWPVEGSLCWC